MRARPRVRAAGTWAARHGVTMVLTPLAGTGVMLGTQAAADLFGRRGRARAAMALEQRRLEGLSGRRQEPVGGGGRAPSLARPLYPPQLSVGGTPSLLPPYWGGTPGCAMGCGTGRWPWDSTGLSP